MTTASHVLNQIAGHPQSNELARLTKDCLFDAVGSANLDLSAAVTQKASAAGIGRDEANLDMGNALDALSSPLGDKAGVLGPLLAVAIALDPPLGVEAEDATAVKLVWLYAHAGVDALEYLDAVMGERSSGLWGALADMVQRYDARGAGIGCADAIVAAVSLASSKNENAKKRRRELTSSVRSPLISKVLTGSKGGGVAPISADSSVAGEIAPRPRGPVSTFFLGLIGWLLVSNTARLIARFALQYRRPAEVNITSRGIQVRSTTKLLGKVVRERQTLIPLDGLARATREVRFPCLGTYAGLVALALGSFVGVSWLVDGIRTASLSLAGVGVLVVIAGVALDFALVSLFPGRKGHCRLVFIPRKGAATCVGWVNASKADSLLAGIVSRQG